MPKRTKSEELAALREYEARLVEGRWLADDPLTDLIVEGAKELDNVELSMFLQALPEITERDVVLDAAIEVCLNCRKQQCGTLEAAANQLCAEYPDLTSQIQTAVKLSSGMLSTSVLEKYLASTPALSLPTEVGPSIGRGRKRYSLQQCIGNGSEGTVYLALDLALSPPGHQTWVAVKRTMDPGSPDEAAKARRVNHPNVVRALDSFAGDRGEMYYVFEHVHGGTLEELKHSKPGRFDAIQACSLVIAIARGVQAAHTEGLIHRDIKPANILMGKGVPKVADFGVAQRIKGNQPEHRVGSLAFNSPQQFRNSPASQQDDIYSLGGLLYWLLTGKFPNGQTPSEATSILACESGRQLSLRTWRADLDSDLDSICGRALSFDLSERYRSADALIADLMLWLDRRPLGWRQTPLLRQLSLSLRRHPKLWTGSTATAGIAVVATVLTAQTIGNSEARRLQAELHAATLEKATLREKMDRASVAGTLAQNILIQGRSDSVPANWIHATTFLEAAAGSDLFGDAKSNQLLWDKRIEIANAHLSVADAAGTRNSLESLLIESSLCVWLIRAERGEDALAHIDRITPVWRSMLKPEDVWLKELAAYRAGAEFLAVETVALDAKEQRQRLLAKTEAAAAELSPLPRTIDLMLQRLRKIAKQ